MLLEIFGFLSLSAMDILDILMVAAILFVLFRWIRGSSAMNIFIAIVILLIVRVIVGSLGMKLMTSLMDTLFDVGLLALIIIFQPEIRHFMQRLGSRYNLGQRGREVLSRLLGIREQQRGSDEVNELAEACRAMSESHTGALIVLPGKQDLDFIVQTGDEVDALVRRRVIMNIFFKNSPLHDGAMIISGGRIVAARCTLPITERTDIPPQYGMRHRAAIGISEETDAEVVVVSEETGEVSFVRNGNLTPIGNINELKLLLGSGENVQEEKDDDRKRKDH